MGDLLVIVLGGTAFLVAVAALVIHVSPRGIGDTASNLEEIPKSPARKDDQS